MFSIIPTISISTLENILTALTASSNATSEVDTITAPATSQSWEMEAGRLRFRRQIDEHELSTGPLGIPQHLLDHWCTIGPRQTTDMSSSTRLPMDKAEISYL